MGGKTPASGDGIAGGIDDVSRGESTPWGGIDEGSMCDDGEGGGGFNPLVEANLVRERFDFLLHRTRGVFFAGESEHDRRARPTLPMDLSSQDLD
jgi:hypothetical protein